MRLKQCILTRNDCYQQKRVIVPKGIMVHSTGANNPSLGRYVSPNDGLLGKISSNHWNQPRPEGRQVCVHAFIGKLADGTVATYQTLPWNHRGWHAGGSANNTHIGFEICEDGLNDPAYFAAVYQEATELCAYLCGKYGLNERTVICHSEGFRLGIASNHADVMHWFPKHGKNMDLFRADVGKLLRQSSKPVLETPAVPEEATTVIYQAIDEKMPAWAHPAIQWAVDAGVLKGDTNGLNLDDRDLRTLSWIYRTRQKTK